MQIDAPNKPPIYPGPSSTSGPNDRRGHASWDMSLHQNLTKLDIASSTPPKDSGPWGQQAVTELSPAGVNRNDAQPQHPSFAPQSAPVLVHHSSQNGPFNSSSLSNTTPYRSKRQGWYNGPLTAAPAKIQRSPEGSSSSEGVSTPSLSTAEYNPSIVNSDGFIEPHPPSHQKVGAILHIHTDRPVR